jgi:lipoate-protein ligase B
VSIRFPELECRDLGSADFDESWELQRALREELLAGAGRDTLLTLEHVPPVVTGGRRASKQDLLLSSEEFAARGVSLRNIERGGSWTWHGPGQLVAYPIVELRRWGLRVPDFVAGLECCMLDLTSWALERVGVHLEEQGWQKGRRRGYPGAWLRRPSGDLVKIGAVGVHFRRFVSLHGLAWNLDPSPWGFDLIRPCGLRDEVTSVRRIADELGGDGARLPTRQEAAEKLGELLPRRWANDPTMPSVVCFSD